MKQYLEVFLLLLLFYLVVQLIRSDKDKIVEGIGPIEEDDAKTLLAIGNQIDDAVAYSFFDDTTTGEIREGAQTS